MQPDRPSVTLRRMRGQVLRIATPAGERSLGIDGEGRWVDPAEVAVVGLHTVFEHHEAMTVVALRAFLHEYRVAFPVGVDAPGVGGPVPQTMGAYGLRGTPSLMLIDRDGRLRRQSFGAEEDMAVGAAIAALCAERQTL